MIELKRMGLSFVLTLMGTLELAASAVLDSGSGVVGPLGFAVSPNSGTGLDCMFPIFIKFIMFPSVIKMDPRAIPWVDSWVGKRYLFPGLGSGFL